MKGVCMAGRLFSAPLSASLKNIILKSRVVASASLHHYGPQNVNTVMISNASNKKWMQPPLLTSALKNISTSSYQLSAHKAHDHSRIWSFERVLSALLLPIVPAALIYPCMPLDTAMALLMVLHTHFGLEAIIVDYIRPILFGNMAPKIGIVLLYLFSIATFAGLLNLIYNDSGLANTIINVWKK